MEPAIWAQVAPTPGAWNAYAWILVVGALTAFAFAWSIGANDVANAFGTSVGAKTLTLLQACCVATIFEFLGALTLGGNVTSTVAQDIARTSVYDDFPEIYMYGMLCALAGAGIWVTAATWMEMAVSTTHSIIGGIIGFSLVWDGGNALYWFNRTSSFPYYSGIVPIISSWFTSPLIAGLLGAGHFLLIRWLILRRDNSITLAFWILPVLTAQTIMINLFFVLLKGVGQQVGWSTGKCAWVSAFTALGSGLLVAATILPLLRWKFRQTLEKEATHEQLSSNAINSSMASPQGASWPDAEHVNGQDQATAQHQPQVHTQDATEEQQQQPAPPHDLVPMRARDPPLQRSGSIVLVAVGTAAADGGTEAEDERVGAAATSQASHVIAVTVHAEAHAPQGHERVVQLTATDVWDDVFARAKGEGSSDSDKLPKPSWREMLRTRVAGAADGAKRAITHGLTQDVHDNLWDDPHAVAMHQAAELFEPKCELVFKYLQVISACSVSFAHGSNDVANAVGPLAAIRYVYQNRAVPDGAMNTPIWVLVIGATGIVIGLMTYGYNIIRALGVKMAKMTPSRGYSAELAVALTVSVASVLGFPISTTHCIVGAEVGLGMCESFSTGTNWRLFGRTVVSWLLTMLIAGLLTAAFFAQGAYAPSIIQCKELNEYQTTLNALINEDLALINASRAQAIQNGLASENGLDVFFAQLIAAGQQMCSGGQVDATDCTNVLLAVDSALKRLSLVAVGYNVSAANFTHANATVPAYASSVQPNLQL